MLRKGFAYIAGVVVLLLFFYSCGSDAVIVPGSVAYFYDGEGVFDSVSGAPNDTSHMLIGNFNFQNITKIRISFDFHTCAPTSGHFFRVTHRVQNGTLGIYLLGTRDSSGSVDTVVSLIPPAQEYRELWSELVTSGPGTCLVIRNLKVYRSW